MTHGETYTIVYGLIFLMALLSAIWLWNLRDGQELLNKVLSTGLFLISAVSIMKMCGAGATL